MSIRMALVQPLTNPPPDDEKNVADAVNYIAQAAGLGAHFVCFPESYPGPWRMPATFDPTAAIREAAAKFEIYVVYGTLEPIDAVKATAYNLTAMAFPDDRDPVGYRRTHPHGPWVYTGGTAWEFQYVPGSQFHVYDTPHGKVGLGMCSEVYVPEVSRALALRGAEFIFLPAGRDKQRLWATWRTLIWARAIENLALVVTTQNLFTPQERGLAMVAGPEEVLFESTRPGLSIVDVDLDRLRWLRETRDGLGMSGQCGVKPGLVGPQWQRPELDDLIRPRRLLDAAE